MRMMTLNNIDSESMVIYQQRANPLYQGLHLPYYSRALAQFQQLDSYQRSVASGLYGPYAGVYRGAYGDVYAQYNGIANVGVNAGESRVGTAGDNRVATGGDSSVGTDGNIMVDNGGDSRVGAVGDSRASTWGDTGVGREGATARPCRVVTVLDNTVENKVVHTGANPKPCRIVTVVGTTASKVVPSKVGASERASRISRVVTLVSNTRTNRVVPAGANARAIKAVNIVDNRGDQVVPACVDRVDIEGASGAVTGGRGDDELPGNSKETGTGIYGKCISPICINSEPPTPRMNHTDIQLTLTSPGHNSQCQEGSSVVHNTLDSKDNVLSLQSDLVASPRSNYDRGDNLTSSTTNSSAAMTLEAYYRGGDIVTGSVVSSTSGHKSQGSTAESDPPQHKRRKLYAEMTRESSGDSSTEELVALVPLIDRSPQVMGVSTEEGAAVVTGEGVANSQAIVADVEKVADTSNAAFRSEMTVSSNGPQFSGDSTDNASYTDENHGRGTDSDATDSVEEPSPLAVLTDVTNVAGTSSSGEGGKRVVPAASYHFHYPARYYPTLVRGDYICQCCGMHYKTMYGLNNHLKRHKLLEATTCDRCGKMFTCKYDMDRHARVHIR